MKIGIVGLGLMGGSMAKAIKGRTGHSVLGLDQDAAVQARALAEGMLDGGLDDSSLGECGLVLLALYPHAAVEYLRANAPAIRKGAVVVDLCGVKRFVCQEALPLALEHGFYFVGGHPMAGREKSGYEASQESLFSNASMLLAPGNAPEDLCKALTDFFLSLGFGSVYKTEAGEHDGVIAYTSQLAHVLSNAYVKSPKALQYKAFSGGSFQDLTRVATLNETMWTELFLLNRDFLIQEIDGLCSRLAAYADALRAEDAEALHSLLREGCEWKTSILRQGGEQ